MIRQSSNDPLHDSSISKLSTPSSNTDTQNQVSRSIASNYEPQRQTLPNEGILSEGLLAGNQQTSSHNLNKVKAVKGAAGNDNELQSDHSLTVAAAGDTWKSLSKTPGTALSDTFSTGPLAPANSADSAMDVSSSSHLPQQSQQSQDGHSSSVIKELSQSYSADEPSSTAAVLGQQSPAYSASSPPMQSATNSSAHNSHESTSAITSTSGTSFHQQQLERIESLENELKRIKQERDALLVENDRLAAQLEMMTAVKQQPRPPELSVKCCSPNSSNTGHQHLPNCSCMLITELANQTTDHEQQHQQEHYHQSYCQCNCVSCPGAPGTDGRGEHGNLYSHSNVPLINGEPDLTSYSCSHESNEALHGSKSVSSFSSFKTTVDNINDEFGALPEHSHYLLQQREQRLLNATGNLAPCTNPQCDHHLGTSPGANAAFSTTNANRSSRKNGSETQTPPSSSTTTTNSSVTGGATGRPHKGILRRESALMGAEETPFIPSPPSVASAPVHHHCRSPTSTPPSALSPSFSKNSVALSVSLNLSPTTSATSVGSPLFGYSHEHHHQQHHQHQNEGGLSENSSSHLPVSHHQQHSNLLRTVRAGGGSSTSLSAGGSNGAPYGYELSQQLLDKQTGALERKYGGREAREAAIKIQRAFRSYRLQKRFTTLAIQAICHQQLKQQKEQQQMKQQQQQEQQKLQNAQQSSTARKESVVVEVTPQMNKRVETLKVVESVNLSPIDREAMQHRFSRKMSANYALDDLVRMQSLQHQQTIQSNASGLPSVHHPNQYLSIPRQASPPVTLVTNYEPVYTPPSSGLLYHNSSHTNLPNQHTVFVQQHQHPHHHHHHQIDGQATFEMSLQKKTSFSSTSSGGSSSSLHASSTSSKPSDVHSSMGRLALSGSGSVKIDPNDFRNLHPTSTGTQSQQPQLLNKQRMQKNSQQQLQQQQHTSAINLQSSSGLSVQQQQQQPLQPSIHRTTSHHTMMIAGNVNGNGAGSAAAVVAGSSATAAAAAAASTGNSVSFAPTVDFAAGNSAAATTGSEAVSSSVDAYRKRQYRVGLNLFNKSPSERGIRFLIANGYIEQSDSSEKQANYVAHFLLTRKGLSRQMIGEYISEPAPFNRQVLKSFCGGVNLTGIIVDEALRSFQVHFRFPGEAQKIERLVESFADRYKECNPGDVLSRDSIFILAFAIIMLNTDLHKPTNIKHRMTPEQWLQNLKGVFQEGDLSSQFLLGIYKRIKKQELQTGGDHVTQVLKVQSTIIGKDTPNLCVPHRRLVCYCRLYEIRDLNRREKVGQHQRDVFLFNDLLLITKTTSRSRNGQLAEYQYRSSCPLDGLQVLVFSTAYYPNGIRISRRVDNKIIACFNARNDLDQQRFVDDLQEAINEMDDMEQLRITKSSSLVTLNTLSASNAKGAGGVEAAGMASSSSAYMDAGMQQQTTSQTVIASPTESYSLGLTSANSVNYSSSGASGGGPNSSVSANGCANQSRNATIATYPYANNK